MAGLTRRRLLRGLWGGVLGGALSRTAVAAPCFYKTVRASGLQFPLLVWGEDPAPPVLLLHGFPQEPLTWKPVAERLAADGFQAIVPWLRGYAPNNRFAPFTFAQFASDCLGIADQLGVQQLDVAGAGIGGALAWMLAAYHPERVRSVTSILYPHPAAVAYACEQDPQSLQRWQELQLQLGAADPRAQAADLLADDAAGLSYLLGSGRLPMPFLQRYLARMREPGALAAALSWHSAASLEEFTWVPEIQAPALLLWSEGASARAGLSQLAAEASRDCVQGWLLTVDVPRGTPYLLESDPGLVTGPLLSWLRAQREPLRAEA